MVKTVQVHSRRRTKTVPKKSKKGHLRNSIPRISGDGRFQNLPGSALFYLSRYFELSRYFPSRYFNLSNLFFPNFPNPFSNFLIFAICVLVLWPRGSYSQRYPFSVSRKKNAFFYGRAQNPKSVGNRTRATKKTKVVN